mmetsp:Transcript_9877/g.8417  ORF Transcript_9877/g.8417 Transcript_9877/m.8417 type:complete len:180 (+) Transcript_9877:71-610(+)
MSFADYQEKVNCSIRVLDLPEDYDPKEILSNLENAGTIVDSKEGVDCMIVTFSNANEKELSKMYDGCPVGTKYTLKLEDPTSLELTGKTEAKEETKPEEPQAEEKAEEKVEEKVEEPKEESQPKFESIPETKTEFVPRSFVEEKLAAEKEEPKESSYNASPVKKEEPAERLDEEKKDRP